MAPLLTIGLLLVTGLAFGTGSSRIGLPRVPGYVLAGILLSPPFLGGPLGLSRGEWVDPLASVALGVIAYLIGGSLTTGQLRRMGRVIVGSAVGESLGAVLVVSAVVYAVAPADAGLPAWKLALVLGAIAASTAPAGTVAVLHQYRAKGPLSNTLLGVVALDDALGLMCFSTVLVLVTGRPPLETVGLAVFGIGGAVVLGGLAGAALAEVSRRVGDDELRLASLIAGIFLVAGGADALGLSPLLATMALGFTARSLVGDGAEKLFGSIEYAEELVFVLFFTLAGSHFDPTVFLSSAGLIVAYLIARVVGKLVGAGLAARAAGAPPEVVRWLGLGLVPQAGIAVGLALTFAGEPAFRSSGGLIVNVVLGTTVIYELLGPVATRVALARAGELGPRRETPG